MVIISEASEGLTSSASARDLMKSTEAAKLTGCRVFYAPQDFHEAGDAATALWHIPDQTGDVIGFWIGYIPSAAHYREVYDALLAKRIRLINNPEQHETAQVFDRAYPHLVGLTPKSVWVDSVEQCEVAAKEVGGFPIFTKGSIQSRKAKGWSACVAQDLPHLRSLTTSLLDLDARSRGRVILRQVVQLRHSRVSPQGFPVGREYRVFVLNGTVVSLGYYWEGADVLAALTADEDQIVRNLAMEAAQRLAVPFVAVDIGQLTAGEWIVIETGDGQFSGLSQVAAIQHWHQISQALESSFDPA